MKRLLLLTTLIVGCLQAEEKDESLFSKNAPSLYPNNLKTNPVHQIQSAVDRIWEGSLYTLAGATLETLSLLSRIGGEICLPFSSSIGNECLLVSHLCHQSSERVFSQIFKKTSSSTHSWALNQYLLSQAPAYTEKDKELLLFLEKHWLAKSAGFYPTLIDWVCPCFGVNVQVNPQTTNTYARDPANKMPDNYKNTVESWKNLLPHPYYYPLLLTRPYPVQDYLPGYVHVPINDPLETIIDHIASKLQEGHSRVVLDLTEKISQSTHQKWLETWDHYRNLLVRACKKEGLNLNQVICIQRVLEKEIGGIRILEGGAFENLKEQEDFLLEWISKFGLSANRIELDRWPFSITTQEKISFPPLTSALPSKEIFLAHLLAFEQGWHSEDPSKILMVKGTLDLLKGLISSISEEKWQQHLQNPLYSFIIFFSFANIQDHLTLLAQEKKESLFFDTASCLEQVHANLSTLLEIFSPYKQEDFPTFYQKHLTSIPASLKSLTSHGLHASGMTSLAGILKAVEKSQGKPPTILYGENTYFETINAAKLATKAFSIDESTEKNWEDFDLILGQFNPVLKRINAQFDIYQVEAVAETVHKALRARKGKPLTLALDCTLDYIDSKRVGQLLFEFQEAIQKGTLSIICYRSGLKFDLFGMDNYCGAPFFMIHNQDPTWDALNTLLNDPILQTDHLSLNWFCLAYQYGSDYLENYRKQIFSNTRHLLQKIPPTLLNKDAPYRIVPVVEEAESTFIDIKITGPLHQIKGAALVGGILSFECMSHGHPLFYRQSMGFYHPNYSILFSDKCTTIRLTLGLDPAQVDLLADCFKKIAAIHTEFISPWKLLQEHYRMAHPYSLLKEIESKRALIIGGLLAISLCMAFIVDSSSKDTFRPMRKPRD